MPGVEIQAVSHARTSRSRGRPDGGGRVWLIEHRAQLSASVAVAAIAVGAALHALGLGQTGDTVWGAAWRQVSHWSTPAMFATGSESTSRTSTSVSNGRRFFESVSVTTAGHANVYGTLANC